MFRDIAIGVLLLVLLVTAVVNCSRERTDKETAQTKTSLTADTLIRVRGIVIRLQRDSAVLGGKIATLKQQKAEDANKALVAASEREQENRRLRQDYQQLSAIKAKQAADLPVGGVGAVNTTVADTANNRDYATLKAQITYYEAVIIPGLEQRVATLEREKSDLERELNGPNGSRSETVVIKQQLADARSFVQDKRSALSKGLGKLINGGKINVLGQVDKKLSDVPQ